MVSVLLCLPSSGLLAGEGASGGGASSGIPALAASVVQQRQKQIEAAQTLFSAGSKAYADQSYAEAMDYHKAAFETLPDIPSVARQRQIFFSRYQSAAFRYAKVLANEAKWQECEQTLSDVVTLAEESGIPAQDVDPELRRMLKEIRENDDRYNQADSPRHQRNVALVETKLIIARGYKELGDYGRADRTYNEVLNLDPYNTAARRGMEEVERWRMNYFDAAYSHTRAKKLAEVKAGWETPVPTILSGDGTLGAQEETNTGGSVAIESKLKNIVIPALEFNGATLKDVVEFLNLKAQELDSSEADPTKRGVNMVIDSSGMNGEDIGMRSLSVQLANIPLGVALKYVTGQVQLTYVTDNIAVRILSPSASASSSLSIRTWEVPPSFLSAEGSGGSEESTAGANPFASPSKEAAGAIVKRITAKQFLIDRGVVFGEGASANFLAATNSLVVRNTSEQLLLVDDIVQASRSSAPKMVEIHVKMVSVGSENLKQLGLDYLLGQSNLRANPGVFVGGGTTGNSGVNIDGTNFPFMGPTGPIGSYPMTSILRTGDIGNSDNIDAVIRRESPTPASSLAPGIFSVAGVFTKPQYQIVLRALDQAKGIDVLADTYVTVRPGVQAKMLQGREFIYPTEYDPPEIPNSFGGGEALPVTPATPTAFETRLVGKFIEVEPTVAADDKTISLNLLMEFTDFSGFINYGTPVTNGSTLPNGKPMVVTDNAILMPVFDTIRETTNVIVWDGQTVAIGGLYGESIISTEDKIPYLGDLPVLGRAFRSKTSQSKKRALTIFVSVRLVDPGGNPINAPKEDEPRPMPPPRQVPIPADFASGQPVVVPTK